MNFPAIVDIALPAEGVFHNLVFVSIRKTYPMPVHKIMHDLRCMGQMILPRPNRIVAPPPMPPGYDPGTPQGRTVEQLEAVVREFETAYASVGGAEMELKLARGAMVLAQCEATALLMAYGHGVRARLGQQGALVRSIPQVWPRHAGKRDALRSAAG